MAREMQQHDTFEYYYQIYLSTRWSQICVRLFTRSMIWHIRKLPLQAIGARSKCSGVQSARS